MKISLIMMCVDKFHLSFSRKKKKKSCIWYFSNVNYKSFKIIISVVEINREGLLSTNDITSTFPHIVMFVESLPRFIVVIKVSIFPYICYLILLKHVRKNKRYKSLNYIEMHKWITYHKEYFFNIWLKEQNFKSLFKI